MVKSALPRAANVGTAKTSASSATAAMRAKLLMRVIWVLLWPCLEPVSQVQADQICIRLVRPVEVVRVRGGGEADRGDGGEGDGGGHALARRKGGGDLGIDGGDAGLDLGDGDVALEVDGHGGAIGRAEAPGARLEEHADVPAGAVFP